MNARLGAKLPDGRRADLEWVWRSVEEGTVIQATVRHDGPMSPEDLVFCLREIAEDEVLARTTVPRVRRKHMRGVRRRITTLLA